MSLTHLEKLQDFPPLPFPRPLLIIGHGTKDQEGRQALLDLATIYQDLDSSRPVMSCFLELTTPTIEEGVKACLAQGYTEISVLPFLLFAARHNKFDITNELDRAKKRYPQLTFHYGRPFGITPPLIDLWRSRLRELPNAQEIAPSDTVLLVIGRGSSDPDANGDLVKMARILWEGSGYQTLETCFIGITHPRLEEGLRRARFYQPKRIIVLPYFLFTGALVKKIFTITEQHQEEFPEIDLICLPEMGIQPQLLQVLREREIETQTGEVTMNCEICKFRLNALTEDNHHHHHHHHHGESGHHSHPEVDPYSKLEDYHQRIWKTP
jgi:sirohydrochlorin cobaltochelatase